MTLDDLQTQWSAMDRKLDESLRLGKQLYREARVQRALGALDRLGRLVAFELALNFFAFAVLVALAVHLSAEPRYLVSALLLAALLFALVVSAVRQRRLLAGMTLEAPVLVLQERLERLKVQRVRDTRWVFLSAPLVWLPLVFLFLRALAGVDGYALFDRPWIVANFVFGVLFIPLALRVTRALKDSSLRSPFLRRLVDDLCGRSLQTARAFLDEVARMERGDDERR